MKQVVITILLFLSLTTIASCASTNKPVSKGEFIVVWCHTHSCYDILQQLVTNASSLQCALYDVNGPLASVLNSSQYSIIVDKDAKTTIGVARQGRGLMHHKFCVVNQTHVVVGSFNPVLSSDEDYNNLLIIQSTPLAKHFSHIHSTILSRKDPGQYSITHNNVSIDILVCPHHNCQQALIHEISHAQQSIQFALFTFTDQQVADVLLQQHNKGLDVQGIVESWQSRQYAQHLQLIDQGIPLIVENTRLLQHNKVFVIDNRTVITGSYNPTLAAHTINDELIIIIRDEQVAQIYSSMIYNITQNFK